VRTLLVDNYDSYTYNLFQLLARVNGAEPVVLRNDDPGLGDADLASFDSIVISPGPGHPARGRDFGACAAIIAGSPVPVLGVCLGHQGIALAEGGDVRPARHARHGHVSRIRHDGRGIFSGIPQDFAAVRYHSLVAVEPLPVTLEGIAWSEDGTLMALRHRSRPVWGVQFHPESVATEHGMALLANFRDLSRGRSPGRVSAARRKPGPPAAAGAGAGAVPKAYRLQVRTLEHEVDAEEAFLAAFAAADDCFWLDSARVEPGRSRFSFLGDGSGPLAETVTYHVGDGRVSVRRPGARRQRREPGTIFDYLQRETRRRRISHPPLPFDFAGGYVGWFGYELKADCGAASRHRAPTPDACWLFADRLLVIDHAEQRTYLLALSRTTARAMADAAGWLDAAAAALAALTPGGGPLAAAAPAGAPGGDGLEPYLLRSRDQYVADAGACRRELLAGESYEICLTNTARVTATGTGLGFYRRLRRLNPAPYAAYLRLGGIEVACSSPERFLRIDRNRTVEARPVKGTAPRGRTPAEDERLRDALASGAKTRAENLMIVDLLRNDLGRVCETGTVHVPELMATETYATVHHLVSTVRGTLRPGVDAVGCVRACFPGGSMTGAPKLRTMEIIDRLETTARGIYAGAIGYLGCNGSADLNIVIRTAVLTDGQWHVGAGGAIVLGSDPAEEYDEMILKATTTLRAHQAVNPAPRTTAPGTTALACATSPGPLVDGAEHEIQILEV
jgi:para-aminobenzoate synthetase